MRSFLRLLAIAFLSLAFVPGAVFAQTPGSAPIPSGTNANTPDPRGAPCRFSTDCPSGYTCPTSADLERPGRRCYRPADGGLCSSDDECANGTHCNSGRCVNAPSTTGTNNTQAIEAVEGHITAPVLAVPIPGLAAFQNPTVQGSDGQQYLDIPFLAQYISAVYTYALGIIVTIATVMVVIGGLKWMLARGDSGKVSDAKETLSRAVIGVLLALGSYAILNLINPELVNLRALRIEFITRDPIEQSLLANTGDNSDPSTQWNSRGGATAGVAAPTGGSGSNISIRSSGTCPVTLPEEENRRVYESNPRSQEFMRQIQTVITGGTREERIVQFLDAAAACRVYLGSCLHSAEIANGFGSNQPGVLIGRGRETNHISRSLFSTLRTFRCTASQPDCNMATQRATVFHQLQDAITNYPDSWLPDLHPGDAIVVFNANRLDDNGNHTQVFVGWLNQAQGRARVLQGSPGQPVRWGNVCLSTRCGAPFPLIKTFRATR